MEKKDDDLIEVLLFNHFGECPVCNHPLSLLQAEYTAYSLSPSGFISSKLDSKCTFTEVCPNCGYTCEMGVNEYGLYPLGCVEQRETREPILKENPLGHYEKK